MADTNTLLTLSRKHAAENSSARFCLSNAVAQHDAGDLNAARMWALKSLKYSVGIFHPDFIRAAK